MSFFSTTRFRFNGLRNIASVARKFFCAAVFAVLLVAAGLPGTRLLTPAPALACESCGCDAAAHAMLRAYIVTQHQLTQQHVALQFQIHRESFIIGWFFPEHILAMLMRATESLTVAAMHQVMMIGALLDAEQTVKTQRLMQEMAAQAHKDYHPSMSMCEFGTMTRSLAPAQRNAEFTSFVLGERQQSRARREKDSSAARGMIDDLPSRLTQFRNRYCDVRDNNTGLEALCKNPGQQTGQSAQPEYRERDVDYERVVDHPLSLTVDFANPNYADDQDEPDVMAIASNLYSHHVFDSIAPALLEPRDNQPIYLDVRSVLAKRAVAENSFSAIVGLKARGSEDGSPDTAQYMKFVYQQLGVENDAEIEKILGERPSYYAQMEILTKKLYQRPEFYTNLYDKPANTPRKEAALRAIGLMQDMDKFKSQLRSEMLLSVILEMGLDEQQRDLQNRIRSLTTQEGRKRQ